jgi:hypothetical protein
MFCDVFSLNYLILLKENNKFIIDDNRKELIELLIVLFNIFME